jgi:hypothetical protein
MYNAINSHFIYVLPVATLILSFINRYGASYASDNHHHYRQADTPFAVSENAAKEDTDDGGSHGEACPNETGNSTAQALRRR